jgi:hypothetical protein
MKALIIKDLSATIELDREELAAVHGGTYGGYCMPDYCLPSYPTPKFGYDKGSIDFNASQMLGQSQNTTVNNGNNVAFSSGISANVNPSQHGSNNISFL